MPRRARLRPYTLYLNKKADARLIAHLEPFADNNRASEEMRRLMEIALGQVEQNHQPVITQQFAAPSIPEPRAVVKADIRKKMKGQFDDD